MGRIPCVMAKRRYAWRVHPNVAVEMRHSDMAAPQLRDMTAEMLLQSAGSIPDDSTKTLLYAQNSV